MNTLKYAKNLKKFAQVFLGINWIVVGYKLTHSGEQILTLAQAIAATFKCLRFLWLIIQYPGLNLVPNKEIDAVIHILEQNLLFNRYFDHRPGLGTGDEADRQAWLQAFQVTQKLFEQHFGMGSMGKALPARCDTVERQWRIDKTLPASCEVCLKIKVVA